MGFAKSSTHPTALRRFRNDISQQMRNIARNMTAEEIDQAARYYEAQL